MAVIEDDRASPNYKGIQANLEKLRALRTKSGRRFEIVELPLPAKFSLAGRDLPPSYANFLIINDAVLVPVYSQNKDARALGVIADQFPVAKSSRSTAARSSSKAAHFIAFHSNSRRQDKPNDLPPTKPCARGISPP